jgi:hypothetical protein
MPTPADHTCLPAGHTLLLQTLPANPVPPPNPLSETINTWSVIRTSAGWMASAQLQTGGNTQVFRSADGVTWNLTPVFNFGTAGRVTLYQALKNNPAETVVFALAANPDRTWLDIFKSTDGGLTFTPLNVLTAAKVGRLRWQHLGCSATATC